MSTLPINAADLGAIGWLVWGACAVIAIGCAAAIVATVALIREERKRAQERKRMAKRFERWER